MKNWHFWTEFHFAMISFLEAQPTYQFQELYVMHFEIKYPSSKDILLIWYEIVLDWKCLWHSTILIDSWIQSFILYLPLVKTVCWCQLEHEQQTKLFDSLILNIHLIINCQLKMKLIATILMISSWISLVKCEYIYVGVYLVLYLFKVCQIVETMFKRQWVLKWLQKAQVPFINKLKMCQMFQRAYQIIANVNLIVKIKVG